MNSSQLLYKISTLEYSIGRKELEYNNSVKEDDKPAVALHKAALLLLQEELTTIRKQFDTLQAENAKVLPPAAKKTRKWPSFFGFGRAADSE